MTRIGKLERKHIQQLLELAEVGGWARWEQRAVPLRVLQSEQRLCPAWKRQSAVLLVGLYSVLQGPTAVMHLADGLLILLQRSDADDMETAKS